MRTSWSTARQTFRSGRSSNESPLRAAPRQPLPRRPLPRDASVKSRVLSAFAVLLLTGISFACRNRTTDPVTPAVDVPARRPGTTAPSSASDVIGDVVAPDGTGLPHVVVRLFSASTGKRATITDAAGRFRFGDIPTGEYSLTATRAGYVAGESAVRAGTDPLVAVSAGLDRDQPRARVVLQRGSVVSGRVLDEAGGPVPSAIVVLVKQHVFRPPEANLRGAPVILDDGLEGGPRHQTRTDDSGAFRISGVSSGAYKLKALVLGTIDVSPGHQTGYPTTYYPSARTASKAAVVQIGAATTHQLDIIVRPEPLSSVSVVLSDGGHSTAGGGIRLFDRFDDSVTRSAIATARVEPDGTAIVRALPPGEYDVVGSAGAPWSKPNVQQDVRSGAARVIVPRDARTVLPLRRGTTISGIVTCDGAPCREGVRIMPVPVSDHAPGTAVPASASCDAEGRFTLRNLFVPSLLYADVAALPGFSEASVRLGTRDVSYTPLGDADGGTIEGVTIELTSQLSQIRGSVVDSAGVTRNGMAVFAFPADTSKWTLTFQRLFAVSFVTRDGQYSIRGLPSGDGVRRGHPGKVCRSGTHGRGAHGRNNRALAQSAVAPAVPPLRPAPSFAG
jgi:Carboxypeptidase regulatory-like domain